MEQNELIRVTQLPVIEEHLRRMQEQIQTETQQAMSLACAPETVQEVKKARAELSKRYAELEEQRKAVKNSIMQPYQRFEKVYKDCVADPFKTADANLKSKIDTVEASIKKQCEDELKRFFQECVSVRHIEWLTWERFGYTVSMTEAKKKTHNAVHSQIESFTEYVSRSVNAISKLDNAEEIMIEYKRTLRLNEAVQTVQERHRRMAEEAKQAEARKKAAEAEAERIAKLQEAVKAEQPTVTAPPVQEAPKAPEKVYRCTFMVKATKDQLRKLKEFMNTEGIIYE